jgi:hypothetical protein
VGWVVGKVEELRGGWVEGEKGKEFLGFELWKRSQR